VNALSLVTSWKGSLEHQRARDIVGCMNYVLDLAVLLGSVGTQHPKLDAMREEESVGGGAIKLMSIIALDAPDGVAKLRGHKGEELGEGGKVLDFWHSEKVHE
jgi:hypothetical protein